METSARTDQRRPWLWYPRFLFATIAAGFASFILLMVVSLPFGGFEFVDRLQPNFDLIILALAVVWSPFIWRRLR